MPAQDGPIQGPAGSAEFEFDLAGPLFHQILKLLDTVRPVPLDDDHLDQVPLKPGVYVLHHRGVPVYVGKADESVAVRLNRHKVTLSGRRGLTLAEMTFRCVCFAATWNPLKPEEFLIQHYKTNAAEGWNGRGFGGNEPGVNRRGTRFNRDSFHLRFPLEEDWVCESVRAGSYMAFDLLRRVKFAVPFYFAFQGNRVTGSGEEKREAQEARRVYEAATITVPRDGMTARELLILVASSLPGEWQASITPSHMLLNRVRTGFSSRRG